MLHFLFDHPFRRPNHHFQCLIILEGATGYPFNILFVSDLVSVEIYDGRDQ